MRCGHPFRRVSAAAVVALTGAASATPDCPSDFNADGAVNSLDVIAFLGAFNAHDPAADIDGDAAFTSLDVLLFLQAFSAGCPGIPTPLAGNALASYPFFEYVAAFNHGAGVSLAIDPTRFPTIAGATADVYIVANRTRAQWIADQSLVDVRPTAQPVTFAGADIQGNTVLLSGTGLFTGDAGEGLGNPFDLVIDVDRDGMLGPGDFIDGLGDEPGFSVVKDLTTAGPATVASPLDYAVSWTGVPSFENRQRTFFPADIASRGRLPLIVISHGNGHDYNWYDYLQSHLASYGFIVMSHQNETEPGIETASTTTLRHTEAIIGLQGTIGGGVLNGHIDADRIVWIGHSRGGEGVARAYDRIFDGTFTPIGYSLADIILISSIAPTDFLGSASANPHNVPAYHLLYGSSDGDVTGGPENNIIQSFHLLERATGTRSSTYVQGADHNDFNCCGFNDFQGPAGTQIGRPEAQQVSKAAYLALVQRAVRGNIPAEDWLWRQNERLRPIGVNAATIIDREYQDHDKPRFVIDDFQTNSSVGVSSSGGAVTASVTNLVEGLLDDNNTSFTWVTTDPMNGMTRASSTDATRGAVFDWTVGADRFLEFEVVPAGRDFSRFDFLALRVCQGTRHPETIATLADLTFTVTLRDGAGNTSGINIGAYGGGAEEPYQRTGSGTGAGWANEFEAVRIRLTDFLTNGRALDLTNVVAVRLDFGASFGSNRGRLGLDDLELIDE